MVAIQNIISNEKSVFTGDELVSILSDINSKLNLDLSNSRIREIEMIVKDVHLVDYNGDESYYYYIELLFNRIIDDELVSCAVCFKVDEEVANKLKNEKSVLSLEDIFNNRLNRCDSLGGTIIDLIQDKFPDHLYIK